MAARRQDAPSLTSAACAAQQSTAPRSTNANEIQFHTRLIPEAWEQLLRESNAPQKFSGIPEGLTNGFRIGLDNFSLTATYIPPNHFKTEQHANVIREKFAQEMELGRISRPFHPDELEAQIGHFTTAPMAVVEQRPGKFRIVIDHSFPRKTLPPEFPRDTLPPANASRETRPPANASSTSPTPTAPIEFDASEISINALINADDFPCDWGSFSECFLMVAEAPTG